MTKPNYFAAGFGSAMLLVMIWEHLAIESIVITAIITLVNVAWILWMDYIR